MLLKKPILVVEKSCRKHGIKELEKINTYKYELKTIQNKKRFGLMAGKYREILLQEFRLFGGQITK